MAILIQSIVKGRPTRQLIRQILLLGCFFLIIRVGQAQSSPFPDDSSTTAGWRLVWADEFNTDGVPNPKDWAFETGFARNHELQWYQPNNAYCQRGKLIIEARRERRPNPTYQAGSHEWRTSRPTIDYTAASLTTRQAHQWQYGRFEMRARIDTRPGLWPAFWSLGVAGEWPANGEIDIMEYYRGMLLANVAWASGQRWTARWHSLKKPLGSFNDPGWSSKFHVWRMDWDERAISLSVDDMLLNVTLLAGTINDDGSGKNPFRQPHYLLLNLALGGDNGGDPAPTPFPAQFEVDYVRVYQK